MAELSCTLKPNHQGEPHAADQLMPLVYPELRQLALQKLAHENPGQTLQATALVQEAYLRLVGEEPEQHWESRGHFFAAAAEAMRRILVENARRKQGVKHGGGRRRVNRLDAPNRQAAAQAILLASAGGDGLRELDEAGVGRPRQLRRRRRHDHSADSTYAGQQFRPVRCHQQRPGHVDRPRPNHHSG